MRSFKTSHFVVATYLALAPSTFVVADPALSQPALREFILNVAQRTHATESAPEPFETRYEFIHTRITEERNPRGELKHRKVERNHHRPGASGKHPAQTTSSASSRNVKDDNDVSRDDFQLNAELLRRFSFHPAGEESVDGRPQQIIDFEPASDSLPVRGFKDKYINQTAGRLWIDSESQVLTRLQMRLRKPVNVWGGLLGAIWEFHFDLERAQTPDADWYTRQVRWHLKGRKLFVSKIIDFHEERTDVRRATAPPAINSLEEPPGLDEGVRARP